MTAVPGLRDLTAVLDQLLFSESVPVASRAASALVTVRSSARSSLGGAGMGGGSTDENEPNRYCSHVVVLPMVLRRTVTIKSQRINGLAHPLIIEWQ
jgi:hypothetical protein